jgi:hypothetical protein
MYKEKAGRRWGGILMAVLGRSRHEDTEAGLRNGDVGLEQKMHWAQTANHGSSIATAAMSREGIVHMRRGRECGDGPDTWGS